MPEIFPIITGIAMSGAYFFQAWRIWERKSSGDVSLLTYAVLGIGNTTWFAYGMIENDTVITLGYVFGVFGAWLVYGLSLYYRNRKNEL